MAKWGRKPTKTGAKALAERIASRERYRSLSPEERKKTWVDGRDKERVRADDRERKRNPDAGEKKKIAARRAAASNGKRGCEICGAKAQAHHTDYNKPLKVRMLCPKHHAQQHSGA